MTDDRDSAGGPLPAGFVEQAVAELLAGTDPDRVVPHVPFRACPGCGARLSDPASFVQEYWVANETRFLVWCRACHGTFQVTPVTRYEGTEASE
ncbi:MAG: hypothetical protein WEE66_10645 [Actinomycetota bacterium]